LLFDDGRLDAEIIERLGVSIPVTIDRFADTGGEFVIAVGEPSIRRSIADRLGPACRGTQLVDPSAVIGDDVELSPGVMVYPGATITTNVRIGAHSHLNCGAVVSHDCRVGDFVSLSPGVALNGAVTVGSGAFLGTGAVVLPGVTIGQDAVVGAGAVVVDDVAPDATVTGVPAR